MSVPTTADIIKEKIQGICINYHYDVFIKLNLRQGINMAKKRTQKLGACFMFMNDIIESTLSGMITSSKQVLFV